MATQKESETAETLVGGFTVLTNPKTPALGPKLDDNGNLGSDHGMQSGDSVSDNEHDAVGEGNEFHGDGISLLVEVHDTLENEKEQTRELGVELIENNSGKEDEDDATEVKVESGAIDDDGRAENRADDVHEEREDDVEEGVLEHSYSIGDFVWGKIKSHPWWPGRIYDPSDASEFAMKYKQTGRLLVVYFGDGSFSWCLPSQLKPFAENFEEMSNQSTLKSFLNGVDKALDEIGSLLELEMTCRCIPQDHIAELSRPLAVNAGVKVGVRVPKGDSLRLSLPSYEPEEVLLKLRDLARTISLLSRLEVVILTSWMSAFYRAKGGYQLSVYYEPGLVEGLEDKTRNQAVNGNDFGVSVEVPIQGPMDEDWDSGPRNCPLIADGILHPCRKQKSVAELMGGVTETGKREADGDTSAKTSKKRKSLTVKCGENGDLNNAGEAKEESEKSPFSRVRKKSKYLSPPYTSPRWTNGSSRAKKEFDEASAEAKEKVLEQPNDLDEETQIGTMNTSASINQVLSVVQNSAINPLYLRNTETLDTIREFISAFRKSVYQDGSNYDVHPSRQSGRKRKASSSLPENHVEKYKLRRRQTEPSEGETSNGKKSSSSTSSGETEDKKVGRKAYPVSLLVTFPPGYPLPSKEETVRIFSKYGQLNKKETNTFYNSNCVQVVYNICSDADIAFKDVIKESPFGSAHVNFRLHSSPNASRAHGGSSSRKRNDGVSQFGSVKQNLSTLNSMLGKCNGKISQEEKTVLEDAMKGLLEKVSAMDTSP